MVKTELFVLSILREICVGGIGYKGILARLNLSIVFKWQKILHLINCSSVQNKMIAKKENIVCSVNAINKAKVNRTLSQIPILDKTKGMANFFKGFADSTRLQILQSLAIEEHCVCDLSAVLNLSISAVSHQLRLLRDLGFVVNRREGKMIYYSLKDSHITQVMDVSKEHMDELS